MSKGKEVRIVDEETVEQMYKAIVGLNDGLTEMYKLNMRTADLIQELHERVLKLEKNQRFSSKKIQ